MKYSNGDVYVGEWTDSMNGEGKLTYLSGACYVGSFLDNCRHGKGELTLANKNIIKGKFDKDSISYGSIKYPNGDIYIGWIQNEMRNGIGMMLGIGTMLEIGVTPDGNGGNEIGHWTNDILIRDIEVETEENMYEWFQGYIISGRRYGVGKIKYDNGDIYYGEINDG